MKNDFKILRKKHWQQFADAFFSALFEVYSPFFKISDIIEKLRYIIQRQ